MGVYIKGMEMPQEKKITITIFPDGRVYENHGERLWGHGKDCIPWKAVHVPPHGRLGDLDEIVRYKERLVVDADKIIPEIRYVVDTKYIVDAPTIIPAEEGQ